MISAGSHQDLVQAWPGPPLQDFTRTSIISPVFSISPGSLTRISSSISPVSRQDLTRTSTSPGSHQYLTSISRPGAAKNNGWTLLHSSSAGSHQYSTSVSRPGAAKNNGWTLLHNISMDDFHFPWLWHLLAAWLCLTGPHDYTHQVSTIDPCNLPRNKYNGNKPQDERSNKRSCTDSSVNRYAQTSIHCIEFNT